jgi:hypothetical protein
MTDRLIVKRGYALVSTTYKLFSATQQYKRDSYQRVLIYTRATLNNKSVI